MDSSVITGVGVVSQILFAVVIIIALELVLTTAEAIVSWSTKVSSLAIDLVPTTVDPTNSMVRIYQDPRNPDAKTLPRSDNERDGLEFSYSMWLNINPSTFEAQLSTSPPVGGGSGTTTVPTVLKHVFHKGTNGMYPLLAPGVFIDGYSNSIVVMMNTFDTWRNMIIVKNVPVQKWVHLVISVRSKTMDVYINSNVVASKTFSSFPKQNYGDVFFFNTQRQRLGPNVTPFPQAAALDQNDPSVTTGALSCWTKNDVALTSANKHQKIAEIFPYVDGTFSGLLSRARYYAYALSFSEINALMREGPSQIVQTASQDKPPYMTDNWWTNAYTQPSA